MRDHLTSLSSSVFSSTLYYTDPSRTATTAKYDGSVSEWCWDRGSGTTAQTYAFTYDGLGRLTNTNRYTGTGTTATNAFTEKGIEYDRNGNIAALTRYGASASSAEDNFSFTLSGNRISSLTNSGTNGSGVTYTSFTHDANGNTTHDGRTGQDLTWNTLNLISGVSVTSGSTTQLATYNWYADGSKYSAERSDGTGYVYKGNVIYEKAANGTLTLECVLTTGGRIVANKNSSGTITGYTVYHHITDHLGSVRAITNAATGTVVETSDFLPFGTRWSQTSGSSSATITDATNRWRYSGKEEQKAINSALPLIDYGARMYDPTIARWMSVDPMAEKYYPMSPYGYCAESPINIIDPNGRKTNPVYTSDGKYRGNTIEGFTGEVIIYDGDIDFTNMTAPDFLYEDYDFVVQTGRANTYDMVRQKLSGSAKSKIWTHIVSQMEGQMIYDEVFSLSILSDRVISYSSKSEGAWNSNIKAKTINGTDKYSYETTVENIQSSVIVHEWYSHIMKKNSDQLKSHRLAYQNVINYKALWNKTTDDYKSFTMKELLTYTKQETKRSKVDPLYRHLFEKYGK